SSFPRPERTPPRSTPGRTPCSATRHSRPSSVRSFPPRSSPSLSSGGSSSSGFESYMTLEDVQSSLRKGELVEVATMCSSSNGSGYPDDVPPHVFALTDPDSGGMPRVVEETVGGRFDSRLIKENPSVVQHVQQEGVVDQLGDAGTDTGAGD
ncbi:unnamed protein product, partial [Cyprideis torosa]